jgi:hypothetical protein
VGVCVCNVYNANMYNHNVYHVVYIYIYIYMCVCVCARLLSYIPLHNHCVCVYVCICQAARMSSHSQYTDLVCTDSGSARVVYLYTPCMTVRVVISFFPTPYTLCLHLYA